MIKVLQVLEMINENSGVSSVVMNYYKYIDKSKVQFDFIVHTDVEESVRAEIEKNGSKIYRMPNLSGKNIPRYKKEIDAFFREHQGEYQIVHGHLPNAAMFYLASAKKYGVKVRILHSHNSQGADGIVKKIRNTLMNNIGISYATNYFACSKLAADYLFRDKKNVYILHNAIDIDKYKYNKNVRDFLRKKYDVEEKFVVGHVGRFQSQKNHKFILDIAETIKDTNIVFVLLGDGILRRQIEEEANKRKLLDKIIFVGCVKNAEDYYQMMDLFILPSIYEGLPVVAVEAQASGLKCVLSKNITSETIITNDIVQLELNDPMVWCKEITYAQNYIREVNVESFEHSGYCIEIEANRLQNKYYHLVENE